ncbi:MAG: hypothetical protein HOL98_12900 [Gammaproteobacteria bacterium]|nr:hypothetical protein [Gammaproteobacteria bacterium]
MMRDRFSSWVAAIVACGLLWMNSVSLAEDLPQAILEPEPELIGPCNPLVDFGCKGTVELEQGEQFTGTLKEGLPDGEGEIVYPNGDVYSGYFREGRKMGQGKYRFANGDTYSGFWVRDRLSGAVELDYVIGDRYVGPLEENKPHGEGAMFFANGDVYRGQWVKGVRTGEGILSYGGSHLESAGDRYQGAFSNNLRHGEGRYIWADGKQSKVSCQYDVCEEPSWTKRFP